MEKKILSISNLSRLSIPDEAQDGLENDLEGILSYIQKLDEVDVEGVEPFYHPHDLTLRLRPDRTEQVAGPESLEGSAGYSERLVRVPRIIE